MKNQKSVLSLVALSITFFLAVCAPVRDGSTEKPINVAEKDFPEFKVAKIESLIKRGKKVGKHFEFFFFGFTYYADNSVNPETTLVDIGKHLSELYRDSIEEELRAAGYKTSSDNTLKVSFSISGTILKAKFNTGRNVFSQQVNGTAAITVKWEVCDQQNKKVIYSKETSGKGETVGLSVKAVLLAFRNSFREFLASNEMVDSIEKYLVK